MKPALTSDEALEILRGRVDKGWLEQLLSDADGQALVMGLVDIFAEVDQLDAQVASSLFTSPHSLQVDQPASGAEKATTTLQVTLKKQVKSAVPLPLPAGTKVTTPDGHVYLTDAPLSWGQGEVGVAKTVAATALLPGHPGAIPPGEITGFVDVARGLSGVGTKIELKVVTGGSFRSLRFRTDTALPHPFRDVVTGMLLEVTSADPAGVANVGRVAPIAKVNDFLSPGVEPPYSSTAPDGAFAWAEVVDASADARYSVWTLGTFGFEWRIIPWDELFTVTNTTAVTGGREAMLDELAQGRGRPRQPGEEDEPLRARLAAAPEPPSPLGVLRKSIRALVPYGFGRLDVRVYELGLDVPEDTDPYAYNFPAACGMISDLHCSDMSTVGTPDGMASADPSYASLSPFFNPGLALCEGGAQRWTVIVRWEPPGGMPADTTAKIRRLLYAAAKRAAQPGCIVQLYYPNQWSYP